MEPSRNAVEAATNDLIAAALSIEADLSGNADSRLRGGYMLIEEARVRHLLTAAREFRVAVAKLEVNLTT